MSRRTGNVVAAIALWLVIVASTSIVAWQVIDRTGRGVYLTDGARPASTQAGARPSPEPTTDDETSSTPSRTSPAKSPTHSTGPPPRPTTPPSAATGPTSARPPATSPPATPPTSTSTPRRSPSPSTSPSSSPSSPSSSVARPPVVSDSVSVSGGSVGVSCQGETLALRFATPRNGWSYTLKRSASEIEVSFKQSGGEQDSEVHARCSRGVPAFETSSSGGGDGADR